MKFAPHIAVLSLLLSLAFSLSYLNSSKLAIGNIDWKEKISQSSDYSVEIYSASGTYIGTLGYEKKFYTKIEDIPHQLIQAFISSEDKDFHQHSGVSLRGIFRAGIKNILSLRYRQGASTITQQLVRDLRKDKEKTIQRKIREIAYALNIEKVLSKSQILEYYLNRIYLGYSYYGVASAAHGYFGKALQELDLSEITLLASIVSAPSRYRLHSQEGLRKALTRRRYVLDRMLEDGYLRDGDVTDIESDVPRIVTSTLKQKFPEILSNVAEDLKYKGLWHLRRKKMKVRLAIQESQQLRYKKMLRNWSKSISNSLEISLIVLHKQSAAIQAIIGSKDFSRSKFNRAKRTRRPIGHMISYLISGAVYKYQNQQPWLKEMPGAKWQVKMDGYLMLTQQHIAQVGIGTLSNYFSNLGWSNAPKNFSLALGLDSHSLEDLASYFVSYGGDQPRKPGLIETIEINGQQVYQRKKRPPINTRLTLAMKNIMIGMKPDWLDMDLNFPAALSFTDNDRNGWLVVDAGPRYLGLWVGSEDGVSTVSSAVMKQLISKIYRDISQDLRQQGLVSRDGRLGMNLYWRQDLDSSQGDVFLPRMKGLSRLKQAPSAF